MNIHADSSRAAFTASKETDTVTPRRRFTSFVPKLLCAVCAAAVVAMTLLPAFAGADEPYGLKTFSNRTMDSAEAPYTVAGGHPDLSVTQLSVPLKELYPAEPVEVPNGTYIRPPVGFIGNPAAAPRCPFSKIPFSQEESYEGPSTCPPGSQVGYVFVTLEIGGGGCGPPCSPGTSRHPLYNLPPERGYPAQFGFKFLDTPTTISVFTQPRTESYGLTVATPNIPAIHLSAFKAVFFGTPSLHGQGSAPVPFLSNQVDCSETEPKWSIAIDSVEHAGALRELGIPDLSDPDWKTASEPSPPVTGCEDPALTEQFDPTIATKPLQGGGPVQADAPAGLAVEFTFPQSNDPTNPETNFEPETPQAPEPKDITVKLPAGLSISPSSAAGLGACSDLASDPAGDQVHYDNTRPVTCPESSKIGSAEAITPLLATYDPVTDAITGPEPIEGSVYLLKPHPGDLVNGQDGKFRLLIQLENERYGANFKLPGVAVANKQTGQLTATFTENPQLPASHLTVTLKSGPAASLATPTTCGSFQTTTDLVPWSTPGTPDAHPTAKFAVTQGPNETACPASPGARPFAPTMSAGTESSKAGASSPFVLQITRQDGEQELSSLSTTMPPGFSAKLAGVPYCSEAAIAAAAAKSGAAELASPSCPAASQVGSVTVGAGPGTNPYYVTGKAYLAGPYKGAPVSLVFITPAVAGPFDLGDVVVRAATFVNPETTQVSVNTDPLPTILDGVPLRLRSLTARIDRPDFTLNPTNCSPLAISATIGSSNGATASPVNAFRVGNCKALGFKPALSLALKGGTKRSSNPALTATLTYPKAGPNANISQTTVLLPSSEFIDNANINNPCTRVQFAANACPASSILGTAVAYTPLLEKPLEGPVYFRSNGGERELPDLVADLNGQIHVDLVGFIDAVHKKGSEESRVRTRFLSVPDAPVTKFVLSLKGGKKGLLENSKNLCGKGVGKAAVQLSAQNGLNNNFETALKTSCKKKKAKRSSKRHKVGLLVPSW